MNAAVLKLILEVLKEIEPFNIRIRNDSAINEDIPVVRLDLFLQALERRIDAEESE